MLFKGKVNIYIYAWRGRWCIFFGNGEVRFFELRLAMVRVIFIFVPRLFELRLFYVKLALFVMPCRFASLAYHSHGFICDDMFGFIILLMDFSSLW